MLSAFKGKINQFPRLILHLPGASSWELSNAKTIACYSLPLSGITFENKPKNWTFLFNLFIIERKTYFGNKKFVFLEYNV